MRNKKNPLLLLLLLIQAGAAIAQHHYAKGLIVTNQGDTLTGFIEQRAGDLNPFYINFKTSLENDEKKYPVDDVIYFSVSGVASYQRFILTISMDPVQLKNVEGYSAPEPIRKAVFLKILGQGKFLTLYSYRDDLKLRLYVLHAETAQPQELVYKVIRVGGNFTEVFAFRDLLKFIAERSGGMNENLEDRINRTFYNEHQILKIVNQINGTVQKRIKIADKASTGFWAGAGINLGKLHLYEKDEYSKNARSNDSKKYWFSVGYDLAKNPYIGAMVFRADVTFSVAEFTTTTHDYRYSSNLDMLLAFRQHTISPGFYGLYNIYNEEKLKFFVSVGIRVNFSSYDYDYRLLRTYGSVTDTLHIADAEPRKVWNSIPVKVGTVLFKKFEIGFLYSPARVLSHGNFSYKYGVKFFQAGCTYHF